MSASTTSQALESNSEVRAGNISRRLYDNDFRVGSYLVHTPSSTPSSGNGGGGGGGRIPAVAGRSNIPGYQSKITTINLYQNHQSPPLSPKKNLPSDQFWGLPGNRNGNSNSGNAGDVRPQQYQSHQSSLNCSPNYQSNSSLIHNRALLPTSPRQTPKAIPRSMLNLKQQACLTTGKASHLQEYEPNNMGDRLSSPTIQHLSINSNSSPHSQSPGVKPHHSVDSDHWNGQLSPSLPRYQYSQMSIKQRQNGGGGDEISKLAPRLPRGVSKIPHQVQAHDNVNANHYQSQESTIENCSSNSNRYLTFSKDQATSHFKSLKEELGDHKRDTERPQNHEVAKTVPTITPTTTTSLVKPKPLERLSKTTGTNDYTDVIEHAKFFTSTALKQQPMCEAFIMTGQSMLKLSCNESENNNNNHKNANSHKQPETKLKSLSLNIQDQSDLLPNSPKKEQHIPTESKQDTTEAKLVVLKQAPPPKGGDFHQNGVEETSSASTTTMKESDEIVSKIGVDTKPPETELQISECVMSASSSCNDRDSARRLAKRLYNLSGFKRSDVCHHLAKSNPFSQMVAEEYVNLFDFRSMKLDCALRKFLSKLQLNGETQERERMLSQFSQRYYDCNKDKFPNADTVQTLVCALILLNTDLHGGHSKKKRTKLSLGAFIDGLNNSIASVQDCSDDGGGRCNVSLIGASRTIAYTFPRHLVIDLYESIRKRPLKCSDDKCDMTSLEAELDKIYSQQVGSNRSNTLPTRRFAPGSNAPSSTLNASSRRHFKQGLDKLNSGGGRSQDDFDSAIQFKSGYLNRKRVFEAHGKPTSKGRRSWRKVYVTLQDLRMIMQLGMHVDSKEGDDQQTAKKASRAQTIAQKMKNTIKIHHSFAKHSTSYTKRDNVFHLRLADQSEFLLQANNEQELNSWVDTINFATACLSSPALPSAISNTKQHQPQNQRPLLPAAYTKLSYWEQLIDHEERLQRLKVELDEHLSEAPNTKNANKRFKTEFIDKIAFLKHEIERYTIYVDLMRKKSNSPEAIILSKHPHIASLIPSDEMILSLPSFAPPRSVLSSQQQINS